MLENQDWSASRGVGSNNGVIIAHKTKNWVHYKIQGIRDGINKKITSCRGKMIFAELLLKIDVTQQRRHRELKFVSKVPSFSRLKIPWDSVNPSSKYGFLPTVVQYSKLFSHYAKPFVINFCQSFESCRINVMNRIGRAEKLWFRTLLISSTRYVKLICLGREFVMTEREHHHSAFTNSP